MDSTQNTVDSAAHTVINPLPERAFGRDQTPMPILGLGGQSLIQHAESDEPAIELIRHALSCGVRYFDTAPIYGQSEIRIGRALAGHRDQAFIATKTLYRKASSAWRSFERSLNRLQTDYVDLLQLHCFMADSEIRTVFSKSGVIHMAEKAKEQGMVRRVGITGHYYPQVLSKLLRMYPFDSVLVPVNPADPHALSFINDTIEVAVETGASVVAMKVMGAGLLTGQGMDPEKLLRYALSQKVSVAIVSARSIADLDHNIATAAGFQPMTDTELRSIESERPDLNSRCNAIYKRCTGKRGVKIAIRNRSAAEVLRFAPGWWHL